MLFLKPHLGNGIVARPAKTSRAPRKLPRTSAARGSDRRLPARRARGLDRAVEIFQLLHAVRKPIAVGEIARRLNAPRSTVYEIVNLFLAAEILEYAGDSAEIYFGRAVYLYAHDYFATHAVV